MQDRKNPWPRRALFSVAGLALFLAVSIFAFRAYQAEKLPKADTALKFTRADLPFVHKFDAKKMLPFLSSAAFDANGDGKPGLFLGGGVGQADAFFEFEAGDFVKTSLLFEKAETVATHGAAHIDFDNDGDTELFLARSDGVILFENQNGEFAKHSAQFPLANNTVPLSIGLGDPNKDGVVDLYVSGYLKLDLVEGQTIFTRPYGGYSAVFLGQSDHWIDATRALGLYRQHNTFTASFVNLDKDSHQDLVVAQDTGVIETWRNPKGVALEPIGNPSVNSYPMGLGFGDIDNDGDVDIWASNVGHTLPGGLLRGDLPKDAPFNTDYYLLENDGTGQFVDRAKDKGVARLGFGWGSVIADIDLDGHQDLLAAQNYARLPGNGILRTYPGKLMLQQEDGKFADATHTAPDKGFGITPIVADFNRDGAPDIVWANLNGPSRAWISNGGTGESVTVKLPNRAKFLGAKIELYDDSPKPVQTQRIIAGEGLGSDSFREVIFGLGNTGFSHIKITLQTGESQSFSNTPNGVISWQD